MGTLKAVTVGCEPGKFRSCFPTRHTRRDEALRLLDEFGGSRVRAVSIVSF